MTTRRAKGIRLSRAWPAVVIALVLAAGACTTTGRGEQGGSATTTTTSAKRGGSVVLAAERWPSCLNPITHCADETWMHWAAAQYVLPKLLYVDAKGRFASTALVKEMPSAANGGVKQDPFRITYRLNPDAVWDDGTPITSADVEFTWQAVLKTTGAITTFGYDKIASIDTSDPDTAVITFKEPFADWPDLFGGESMYVLKKAAFPDGPDTAAQLGQSIPFSGGPWKLEEFTADHSALVPNARYWDKAARPLLDRATFVLRADQDAEINSLLAAEIDAAFPQPVPGYAIRLDVPGVAHTNGASPAIESLWLNLSKPPLDDKTVRKALFMAVDREQIINAIIRPDAPRAELLNCAAWTPTIGEWCDDSQYKDLDYDPDGAKQLLVDAGWVMGQDGVFAKGGERLDLEFSVVAGNTRREQIQQLMIHQAKRAGIEFHVKNYDRATLFDSVIPHLEHVSSVYVQVARPDPSVTDILSCDAIPKSPDFKGQNNAAWCNEAATTLMHKSDGELDPDQRVEQIRKIGQFVHDDYVTLPLYQFPAVVAWRTDKVAGPVDAYTNSIYTAYWNINRWHVP